jgi:nicotinate-nucleotide adenylyltransferase
MSKRIGILGGTFDPIHCGHLDLGKAAREALSLDEIVVVPTNIPPHRAQPVASSHHRFAMVAVAINGMPGWRLSDIELREERRSYTSLTLARMHEDGFDRRELVFIAGADAFAEVDTWHDYPSIFDLAHFAVVARPGYPVAALKERLPALAPRMIPPGETAFSGPGTMIFLIERKTADVSSTAIRQRRLAGEPIADLVPEPVRQYIEQQELYLHAPRGAGAGLAPHDVAAGRLHGQD